MKNLLVAVDFSKSTAAVLTEAAGLAIALDAKLWVIHITSNETQAYAFEASQFNDYIPDLISTTENVQLARNISAEEIKREHAELLGISSKLRNRGVDAQALLLKGNPAKLILEKAEELEADMIILGSHGHGLFHKALLGSISESIIRQTACNVLVIPPPTPQEP